MDPIFQYKMKVRDYELDIQHIVNNANYQHYYEVGRHEFLEILGTSFSKLREQGIDVIVSSLTLKYKRPLKASEEFFCTVDSLEKKGIRYYFNQRIIRISDNVVCNEVRVETVCTRNGSPIMPEVFDKLFAKFVD